MKSEEVKVDRTQATEFGNRLKLIEQRLNSLQTSVMQDAIMMPRRDAPNAQVYNAACHLQAERLQNVL